MTERPSYSTSLAAGLALAAFLAGGAADVVAQSGPEALCAGTVATLECQLAGATVQVIHPRLGLALWGGSPVPGTASTAGLRVGRSPRLSAAARIRLVPTTLPPLLDRTEDGAETGTAMALSLQSSVALVHGLSPLPTVGGVLSVDLLGRLSVARVPVGKGFGRGDVWGVSGGVRVGLLRESFTLPGVSVTATYGHSTTLTFGDPSAIATDGFTRGSVSGLGTSLAVSRWLFGVRLAGNVAWDRYASNVDIRYAGAPSSGPESVLEGKMVMRRWSGSGSVSWSRLIYHSTLEVGWQAAPTLPTLPAGVDLSPVRWWLGLAFRVTP